jgi:tetratricopeptide (TPR) repeat protein
MKAWSFGIVLAVFSLLLYCASSNAAADDASLQRQLGQARVLLAGAKTAVGEFWGSKKRCPVTNEEAGLAEATLLRSDWITETGVGVNKGACTVAAKFGDGALPALRGKFLGARLNPDSSWECFSDVDAQYVPCKQEEGDARTPTSAASLPQPAFKLTPPEPPRLSYLDYLGRADTDATKGDFEQSLLDAQKGLEIARQEGPANSEAVFTMRGFVVNSLIVLHRDADARQLVLEQLRSKGKQDSPRSVNVGMAQSTTELAEWLENSDNPGNVAKSPALFQQALDLNKQEFGPQSKEAAISTYRLGHSYATNNKMKEAEQAYRQAVRLFQGQTGAFKTSVVAVDTELADLLVKEHRYVEADVTVRQAIALEATAVAAKQLSPNPDLDAHLHELQNQIDAARLKGQSSAKQ